MRTALFLVVLLSLSRLDASHAAEPPRSTDPRITIELFAESPQISTPTGIDIDSRGRVWAIECHTHFPPEGYAGPDNDRLLILTDENRDGRCDTVKTFAQGFTHTMSVAVRPVWMDPIQFDPSENDGSAGKQPPLGAQVFLATRRAIWLLEDTDGDDVCDRQTQLAWLETKGNYPHNGLAGFAFDSLGWMYFGFGENLGEPYTLYSREIQQAQDSTRSAGMQPLTGHAEGGNVYRMRPDGSQLSHWATGFWNPHASCVDALGNLFTVDNDPDSRPPCRLLHVIEGGDYGYRFRNGRKGLHPFTSWNGEVPGTLPMVAGTGEAPSGVLAYEHNALPEMYRGRLLVTSWGDHRIDTFYLNRKGISFESVAEPLIIGAEDFRPVGIALAPDGSLYCTDWVLQDYKVHGRGRVWRIRAVTEQAEPAVDAASINESVAVERLEQLVSSSRLDVRRKAARTLARVTLGLGRNVEVPVATSPKEWLKLTQRFLDRPQRQSIEWLAACRNLLAPVEPEPTPDVRSQAREQWLMRLQTRENQTAFQIAGDVHNLKGLFGSADSLLDLFEKATPVQESPVPPEEQIHRVQLEVLLRARLDYPGDHRFLSAALNTDSGVLKRLAVQWTAEEQLKGSRPQVEAVLKSDPMTTDLFLATLAALEILDGKSPQDFDKTPAGKYVLPLLQNSSTPAAVKVQALRLADPADTNLTLNLLETLMETGDDDLKLEVVRTLQSSTLESSADLLASVALETRSLQGEAILGLANVLSRWPENQIAREALMKLLPGSLELSTEVVWALTPLIQEGSVRNAILDRVRTRTDNDRPDPEKSWDAMGERLYMASQNRGEALVDWAVKRWHTRPQSNDDWVNTLSDPDALRAADSEAGRRVFYHPLGPGCAKCHTVNGRGGKIGPDLSRIGAAFTEEKLIDSILHPSKEISPQFTTWNMATNDGQVHTGMIVHENQGETILGKSDGTTVAVKTIDIEARLPQTTSIMPEKLAEQMTVQDFRNLVAFLKSLK